MEKQKVIKKIIKQTKIKLVQTQNKIELYFVEQK